MAVEGCTKCGEGKQEEKIDKNTLLKEGTEEKGRSTDRGDCGGLMYPTT